MKISRFLARVVDYSLFYSFLFLINCSGLVGGILFFTLPLLFFPIEALFYATIKTTPGKWIFGIKLSKRLSLFSSFVFAAKKALLVLPLFFPPLNIFFLLFYLRESESHVHKRWNRFKDCEIIETKRNSAAKYTCVFFVVISLMVNFIPRNYKSELISVAKQEVHLDSWVEVKDPTLNFSIYFPKAPEVEKKDVDVEEQNTTLNITEYSHTDKVSYSLVSSKIPSSWTFFGSSYLFKSLGKAIETHQGQIISKEISKHDSYPSMHYLLKNHDGGQTKGVLILVKKTIYKLEVKAAEALSNDESKLAADFISTFNIT